MKNKIKIQLKRLLIINLIICILLPSLFSGIAFAETYVANLTTERAGNYAANFAINFYENWSSTSSRGLSPHEKVKAKGEVKTVYDSSVNAYNQIDENAGEYALSNNSWIGFVYSNALFSRDIGSVYSGVSGGIQINTGNFDSKKEIFGDEIVGYAILDIQTLISEGKVVPGDILIAEHDGMKDNLLFVGGAKVIYATEDADIGPSGALKYEYIDKYLKRIREKYDEKQDIPEYGVTEVYRIKKDVAESISETDANLIFNGRGYYSKSDYKGLPKQVSISAKKLSWTWVFDGIIKLLKFFINLVVYMVRMQVIGWANLFENLIQHLVFGLSGHNESISWESFFGARATSASGNRLTVESIFFNKIPILDANFFNFETAGGRQLVPQTAEEINAPVSGPLKPGEERQTITAEEISYEDNLIYTVRKNLATIYVVFRNIAIAVMLFILVGVAIRMAVTSISEKKAKMSSFLVTWLYCFVIIFSMHMFMYLSFQFNDVFVKKFEDIADTQAKEIVIEDEEGNGKGASWLNLYDAVRIKAYAFNWTEGVPATVVYIFLIYLEVRFLLIYFKRYLTIYLLAISAPFIGLKHAIESLVTGKKSSAINKWFKDFGFNVLLQTVHSLIYVIFISMAMRVSQDSVAGALVAIVILNFMLKADSTVIKIFGLDKADSLADVNRPESWSNVFRSFLPMYTVGKSAVGLVQGTMFSDKGLFTRVARGLTGAKNKEEADKILDKWKFNTLGFFTKDWSDASNTGKMGKFARAFDKTWLGKLANRINTKPIQRLGMLGNGTSYETSKQRYADIKKYRKLKMERFTRNIQLAKDLTLGMAGRVAAIAVAIDDPSAGAVLFKKSNAMISKHKTLSKTIKSTYSYKGTVAQAFKDRRDAKDEYNIALDEYTDNEYKFEQDYNKKLDDCNNAFFAGNTFMYNKLKDELKDMLKKRRKERAKELHRLQEADEQLERAKVEYENAKHERNSNNIFGKAAQNARKFGETITGLGEIENIVNTETRASFKAKEAVSKQDKFLDYTQQSVKQERDITNAAKMLNNEYKAYARSIGMSDDDAKKLFEKDMNSILQQSKNVNISSEDIIKSINKYSVSGTTTRLTGSDVDGILNELEAIFVAKGKGLHIDADIKDKVRKQFEFKQTNDNKGLGYDAKEAAEAIREALGMDGVLPPETITLSAFPNHRIAALHSYIVKSTNKLNTYNEVGKIKHKSSVANVSKIFEEIKKNRK